MSSFDVKHNRRDACDPHDAHSLSTATTEHEALAQNARQASFQTSEQGEGMQPQAPERLA